jgi:carboxyl-terminal processing protease
MKGRRTPILLALLVLCPVLLVAGVYLGGHPNLLPGPARDALVDDETAQVYDEAIDRIAHDYYRPVGRKRLLNSSLDAAVASLDDRFSNYFSPSAFATFQQQTSGQFVGVGVSVQAAAKLRRGLEILTVYDGSPAKRAGLRPGDLITAVEGKATAGRSTEEVTAQIKGEEGTAVRLTLRRDGTERTERVQRARVSLPIVQSRMERSGGRRIAYVSLSSFTSGAHGELGAAVRKLLGQGAKGVVLDLRDNGGGLLDEAVLVSSIFIPEGTIVSTRGRAKPRQVYRAAGNAIDSKIPVAVLVNGNSASASEIVTGALQDRKRARVVGTKTFGKGVFQEVRQLSNGGALDITVGEYFLPSGRNLGGGGVKRGAGIQPDVKVRDDVHTKPDEALRRALAVAAAGGAGT